MGPVRSPVGSDWEPALLLLDRLAVVGDGEAVGLGLSEVDRFEVGAEAADQVGLILTRGVGLSAGGEVGGSLGVVNGGFAVDADALHVVVHERR